MGKPVSLLIYGASGHAKVVVDLVKRCGQYNIVGLLDDNSDLHGKTICNYPVLGGFDWLVAHRGEAVQMLLAIGDNHSRRRVFERLQALGARFASPQVHPAACLGSGVTLGLGTVVMAGAVVNADAAIGAHVIVNTSATVDHDCVVGDFAHIAPGVHLAGGVRVGRLTHIGIGACVIQGVTIGEETIIGAGAVVVEDIPARVVAAGVPARVIRRIASDESQAN